ARGALLASMVEQGFALVLSLGFAVAAHLASRHDGGWTALVAPSLVGASALGACVAGAHCLEWITARTRPATTRPPRWRTLGLLRSALWSGVGLAVFGAGYLLLVASGPAGSGFSAWPRDVAAIFYGTFAGLAVVFVPGGMGVREGVAAEFGRDGAAFLAAMVLGRIAIVVAELGYFAVVRMLRR
ncbi:MAG TPA: hypothetical protein VFO79_13775, partial [Xanthomonadales bacterium]|nr:hypothetical protein [Xanthomonadales bacterium]